uniref:Uncharacterized protein n=1 Tax=Ciona savignyi TaxID=51511 RepID=H2Z9H7_CIOSA
MNKIVFFLLLIGLLITVEQTDSAGRRRWKWTGPREERDELVDENQELMDIIKDMGSSEA